MKHLLFLLLFAVYCIAGNGCYSYRIATNAQEGAEKAKVTAHNWFWGLAQSPKQLTTPDCDTLGSLGMSEVRVKTNLGYALLTVVTLGIYCPVQLEYKCSKPCPKNGIF
ncbi:hypothetical protein F0L74_24350 [Chitinophaga agrisoli]|uniref:Bor protein n=1 Tax=Chitinophaga agrisoli TaxID=2607653 RepID=A0A5B2VMC8_9BACT|nr:hypothetical protein [Chitinophaga agrisoli]KAA2239339.1 hypothetical protein F0L74_24350 [Chitinophaga agrisoli]